MNKDTEEDHTKCPGLLTRCLLIELVMLCSQNTAFIETKHFRNTKGSEHRQTKHL